MTISFKTYVFCVICTDFSPTVSKGVFNIIFCIGISIDNQSFLCLPQRCTSYSLCPLPPTWNIALWALAQFLGAPFPSSWTFFGLSPVSLKSFPGSSFSILFFFLVLVEHILQWLLGKDPLGNSCFDTYLAVLKNAF